MDLNPTVSTTTTTATFVVAVVASSQTVVVASTAGISNGTLLGISDGTHAITGHVTGISGHNLTVVTDLILNGASGNTMASGALVSVADGVQAVNNNQFGTIFSNVLNSTTAIAVRLTGAVDDDCFENTFTNLFALHNHIGLYLGNSDNNSFYNVQVYSNASTIVKINGQPGDVYCTTQCRINRIYSMAGYVQCVNGASMAVYSMDPVDASNGAGGPFVPPAYVDSTSFLTITNVDGNGFYPRGTWWYSKGIGAGHTFAVFTDDSYYSPIGGAGSPTNDLYFQSPVKNSGNPVSLSSL